MDLDKYDKLRKKIKNKDFETNNKGLDKWLFRFSFIGNISSIFFAYFLVYPSLLKGISLNLISGFWGAAIAFTITIIFLAIFEIIKRGFIFNFSNNYFENKRKINGLSMSWLIASLTIIILSFYLSITGSKNLATTSIIKNTVVENQTTGIKDSITNQYGKKIIIYSDDNESLRNINNDLRKKLTETPLNYVGVRKNYQENIDKNTKLIYDNQTQIDKINTELELKLSKIENNLNNTKSSHKTEDVKNIFLFIIIVVFNELAIISGIYFREFYENKLYDLHHNKFEKLYLKKDRYRSLLTFIYANGKLTTGDKVISGIELKKLISEKTTIPNTNRFIEEFLSDMNRLGIFNIQGKRRFISVRYEDAIEIVNNFDDAFRALNNMS
jgi:hypothetical protein